jgi:hypothetical protein
LPCSWFRATVEHCFARFKRFGILSGRYRGRLHLEGNLLSDVIKIISAILVLQIRKSPLRRHDEVPLIGPAEMDAIDAAAEEAAAADAPARVILNGLEMGDPLHDIRIVGDGVAGPGEEPSNEAVDSAKEARDFDVGETVIAWWWGLHWKATVKYRSKRSDTLTLRWHWSGATTPHYLARLVYKDVEEDS